MRFGFLSRLGEGGGGGGRGRAKGGGRGGGEHCKKESKGKPEENKFIIWRVGA